MDEKRRQATGTLGRPGSLTIQRVVWACAAILAMLLLQSVYHQPVGWAPAAIAGALVILSAFRPYDALLLTAALGPLAAVAFVLTRSQSSNLRFEEAMVLAFLAGWAARRALLPRPLAVPPWVSWSATILITAALASAIVSGAIQAAEQPGTPLADLLRTVITQEYLIAAAPLAASMLIAEGLLLMLIVAHTCAGDRYRRDRVLLMMVIGAAAAALLNVLRLVMAAARGDDPWTTFLTYLATVRVNIHHGDLNAAGSYFAMMLFIALGLTERARVLSLLCAVSIAAGLWVSGSRTAMAAAMVTATFAGMLALRRRVKHRYVPALAALALLAVLAAAAWTWYPQGRNLAAGPALAFRVEMAKAGLQMTAEQPFFGVGLGRFYPLSGQYASTRENAHNNFMQVLAELGIPGLVLFVGILVLALREAWRSAEGSRVSWALIAGLAAFLLTCLGGHPLLVAGAAYPFWIAVGLAAAPLGTIPTIDGRARLVAVCLLVILAATLPFRTATAVQQANVEHASIGFSLWQHQPDGSRYRWAGARSTFFVASSARAVRIPLRRGTEGPDPIEVRIFLDGREADRVLLHSDDQWRTVRLLPGREVAALFSRIDLEAGLPGARVPLDAQATNDGGVLMVGRPIVEQ